MRRRGYGSGITGHQANYLNFSYAAMLFKTPSPLVRAVID